MTTSPKSRYIAVPVACLVALAGAGHTASAGAGGAAAEQPHLKGAVVFYDPHPQNGGDAGYVLVARLQRRLPKGDHIVGQVGDTFPVTALDAGHACYSGGVRPFGATKKVRYGGRYRVRIWIGKHPDPDHTAPTSSFMAQLRHVSTGKARARRLGCSDPNGYLG